MSSENETVSKIVAQILKAYPKEMLDSWAKENKYLVYQDDPVSFGEKELRETYTEDIKKMMSSVKEYPITVAISGTSVGKSFSAASIAIWWYKCFNNSQVYTAAAPPEENLKRILWGEIGKKAVNNQEIFKDDKFNVLNISRSEWSFITGVSIPQSGTLEERESRFSGKHSANLLFIIDEGDAVPDEVFKGIDGCMSGGHARLLIMFNPKRESGAVYRMIRDGRANVVTLTAFNHPNVITGRNIIPGAVTREITVKRINELTVQLSPDDTPDSSCFTVPDFLVGETTLDNLNREYLPIQPGIRRITDPEFSYKVLGRYPSKGSNQLISREWLNSARTRWDLWVSEKGEIPPEGIRPILGLDVADMGDDWNVVCKRYGGFVSRLEKWSGVDPSETAERTAEIAKFHKSLDVKVDSIGVGASVAPLIRKRGIKSTRVMVSESPTKNLKDKDKKCLFGTLRDQLWWDTREWLRLDNTAMLPPDEKLLEELLVATYEERMGKIKILSKQQMRKLIGRSPDEAESLILTFSPKEKAPKIRML